MIGKICDALSWINVHHGAFLNICSIALLEPLHGSFSISSWVPFWSFTLSYLRWPSHIRTLSTNVSFARGDFGPKNSRTISGNLLGRQLNEHIYIRRLTVYYCKYYRFAWKRIPFVYLLHFISFKSTVAQGSNFYILIMNASWLIDQTETTAHISPWIDVKPDKDILQPPPPPPPHIHISIILIRRSDSVQ